MAKSTWFPPHPAIQALMGSEEYSDLVLVCKDGRRLNLHRAIVCPQSEYFRGLCKGRFKENSSNKFESKLSDDDPEHVARVINYFYTADYEDGSSLHCRSQKADVFCATVLNNIAVYALADKLMISGLKELAKAKFEAIPWSEWATPINCARMAEAACTTAADSGLRDVVLGRFLKKGDAALNDASAQKIMLGLRDFVPPDFFVEVMLRVLRLRDKSIMAAAAKLKDTSRSYENKLTDAKAKHKKETDAANKRFKDERERIQKSTNQRIGSLDMEKKALSERLAQFDPRFSSMQRISDDCSYRWGNKKDRHFYISLRLSKSFLMGFILFMTVFAVIIFLRILPIVSPTRNILPAHGLPKTPR